MRGGEGERERRIGKEGGRKGEGLDKQTTCTWF